jgi:hypothetical protein
MRTSLPYSETVEDRPAQRGWFGLRVTVRKSRRTSLRAWLRAARGGAERALELWHLCSLDAATVAVVWSTAFAWAAGVRVPAWALAMQALTVWAVYVGDRLLDARAATRRVRAASKTARAGMGARDLERLRARHFFHWRHRRALAPAAAVAACAAAGLILVYMPAMARVRSGVLGAAALVYFARVHFGSLEQDRAHGEPGGLRRILKRGLPTKEMVVGVLFAVGCALPAMGRMQSAARGSILCVVGFFALLAWLNCRWIEIWESAARNDVTRWFAGWVVLGVGLALAAVLAAHERTAALLLAGALSAALLAGLNGLKGRMRPVTQRAAADLVLLTPVLLTVTRMGR